jgi:amidase
MTDSFRWQAAEIAEQIRAGAITAARVARDHLDRIEAVNPGLNAIVQHDAEAALQAAAAVDTALARGDDPGALAGVPVTIKVNVDQVGQATTNGLTLQRDLVAQSDSPVVANLRAAGAVIVGRTNTPAFSMRWFTDNGLHGRTLNPRNATLTPGGSSGGAASAVAAGMCAIGHGTDIAGSIRYPAYACGLQGIRPTLGRVPARNASAPDRLIGAQMMAVSGPIARSVADLRLALAAMAAGSVEDPWWVPAPLDLGPVSRRVALIAAPDGMPVAPEVGDALERAAAALRAAGWKVDAVAGPGFRRAADINARLWMAEARLTAQMIAREGDPAAQFVFSRMTAESPEMDLPALMEALRARVGVQRDWARFLADYPVVLCPSSGMLPFEQDYDLRSEVDFDRVMEAQLIQRALPTLGMPGLAVSTGLAGAAPCGVQLIADRFREEALFQAGEAIEAACGSPTVADPEQDET